MALDKWLEWVILITSLFILIQLIPCFLLSFQEQEANQKVKTEIHTYDFVHRRKKFKNSLCTPFSSCFIKPTH